MVFDYGYLLWVMLPTLVLTLIAQGMVKGRFARYSRVAASSGLTGAQAAYEMLRSAGLESRVRIEQVQGFLSDHYDPREKVLRLSPDVYGGRSIAAIGVACHEVGHAMQDAQRYLPLVIRNLAVPAASIGSNLGMMLIMGGFLLMSLHSALGLSVAWIGVIMFAAVVFFQVVNLPVEFDASARAKQMATSLGFVSSGAEAQGVSKVLNAAALTYVAATLTAVLNLLYYASILLGRREE
jgi:Zn-dependent membrane protease YugP